MKYALGERVGKVSFGKFMLLVLYYSSFIYYIISFIYYIILYQFYIISFPILELFNPLYSRTNRIEDTMDESNLELSYDDTINGSLEVSRNMCD